MIVKNVMSRLNCDLTGNFKFASLTNGKLRILEEPLQSSVRSDSISLKDGKYRVIDGVLYIEATRLYYEYVPHFAEKVENWGIRDIYLIDQEQLDALENPPTLTEVIIHRWWRNNKKILAYEIPFSPAQETTDKKWFKCKLETPFEYAGSKFVVREDLS
jgi:hypothetical protein